MARPIVGLQAREQLANFGRNSALACDRQLAVGKTPAPWSFSVTFLSDSECAGNANFDRSFLYVSRRGNLACKSIERLSVARLKQIVLFVFVNSVYKILCLGVWLWLVVAALVDDYGQGDVTSSKWLW